MEWIRRLFGGRGTRSLKGLSPEEFVEALQRWRQGHEYAWWLNDSLDAVSRAAQQQLGLFRETRVAVAVRRKRDISEADRERLVEGCEKLLAVLEGIENGLPAFRGLWPGLSHQPFRDSVDSLKGSARATSEKLRAGRLEEAYEAYKDAVDDWLRFSVPLRYRLNAFMRESLPPEVVASLPDGMLPAEPPRELRRYMGE